MSNRTKFILLGLAAVLLVVAAVWSVQLAKDDTLAHLAEELNAFGYSLEGEDIYVLGESRDISIQNLRKRAYLVSRSSSSERDVYF